MAHGFLRSSVTLVCRVMALRLLSLLLLIPLSNPAPLSLLVPLLLFAPPSSLAASPATSPHPLELLVQREPAAALQQIEQRRSNGALEPAEAAFLHLLAAEAHGQLSRGRQALTEADAGLALLAVEGADISLEPVPVRLQLIRAQALDLLGESSSMLAVVNRLIGELEQRQPELRTLLVEALSTRGMLLTSMNDAAGALKDLQQAYALAEPSDLRAAPGDISSALGNLYTIQYDSENAIIHYRDAIEHYQRTGAKVRLSIVVYGLGLVYRDTRNWSEARRHFGWSLELSREQKDIQGVAYAQKELAGIAINNREVQEAQALLDAAEPLLVEAEDQLAVVNVTIMRAELAGLRGRFAEAERALSEAEARAERYELQWMSPKIWQQRADLLAEQHRFEEAYRAYQRFHELHEANFRSKNSESLQALRVRFESELREQQNVQLRQQNARQEATLATQQSRLILYIAVAALSVTLTIFLLYALHKGKQLRQRLNAIAHTDELTELPNRRHLMQLAHQEVERARRYRMPLALAVLDLDHFKSINDRFGHAMGDDVLRQFAVICRAGLRQMDTLGRVGGEEFVLLLPHTSLLEAEPLLQRLRQAFREHAWPRLQDRHQPTVSIGLTELGAGDNGLADLLRRADEALYQAKQDGRDCVIVRSAPSAPHTLMSAATSDRDAISFEKY